MGILPPNTFPNILLLVVSGVVVVFVFLFDCHPRRGSLWGVGMSLQTADVQIVNYLQIENTKDHLSSEFRGTFPVLASHEDCWGCPAPPWGATVPSALRAELCKYAPFPFLLPSAGLNANSKYCTARDGK